VKIKALAFGLVLLAASAFAADVDGKWFGNLSTPDGDVAVSITLKADGTALTGTTTGPDGSEIKIANGKIDGNNLTFSVTFDFGGMPLMIDYKGVLAGNQIKFTLDVFGMPMDLLVKKTT
jgi:hypothetical protein